MSDYKLCKRAGLDIQGPGYIDAYQVEALLALAPVVSIIDCVDQDLSRPISIHCYPNADKALANARLILIEPIHQESEEIRLLRELVSDWEKYVTNGHMNKETENRQQMHLRAKEFLKRRDGGR